MYKKSFAPEAPLSGSAIDGIHYKVNKTNKYQLLIKQYYSMPKYFCNLLAQVQLEIPPYCKGTGWG